MLLKSLFDHNKIVAKGCLESASPDQYVGGRRLGSNWCAVQISVPMEWDEDLIRPYLNFSTIGDAIGTSVAWPCHLVISLFKLFLSCFIRILRLLFCSSYLFIISENANWAMQFCGEELLSP